MKQLVSTFLVLAVTFSYSAAFGGESSLPNDDKLTVGSSSTYTFSDSDHQFDINDFPKKNESYSPGSPACVNPGSGGVGGGGPCQQAVFQ